MRLAFVLLVIFHLFSHVTSLGAQNLTNETAIPSERQAAGQFRCGTTNVVLENQSTRTKAALTQIRYATLGVRSALVIRVDFTNAVGAAVSEGAAKEVMRSVDAFYRTASFQQLSIPDVSVTPVLRLPGDKRSYAGDSGLIAANARAAAEAAGYDLNAYDFLIYTFPPIGFAFSGLGWIGGKGIWVEGNNFIAWIIAHEIGHNLGLPHANSWTTPDDSIIGPGRFWEYGNTFDVMGASPYYPSSGFNATFRYWLGWLTDADIQVAESSGVYRIFAVDGGQSLDGEKQYGLRVPANVVMDGVARDYWLDVRQALTYPHTLNGALVKASTFTYNWFGNVLLDMNPATEGQADAPLVVGRTFADAAHHIYITPVKRGIKDDQLYVDIFVNRDVADNQAPVVEITASATSADENEPNPRFFLAEPRQTVTFNANASDPDGDALAYYWEFNDGTLASELNKSAVSKSWTYPGIYQVQCTVSDMKGGTASRTVVVQVGSPINYTISGRVLAKTNGVSGARVYTRGSSGYHYAITDSDGYYLLTGFNDETNLVTVVKAEMAFTAQTVVIGPSVSNLDFNAVLPVPVITDLQPTHGPPGSSVLANGANFVNITSVRFGQSNTSFTVFSPSLLVITVPPDATTATIVVSNENGTATSVLFTVDPVVTNTLPSISFINPPHGEPGTIVNIAGANLSGTTSVRFGDIPASVNFVSDRSIGTRVPLNAANARVVVTTASGSATSSVPFVVDPPRPVSIVNQPAGGYVTEGSNAVLEVQVSGSAPFGFQWQRNGLNLAPTNTPRLVIPAATLAEEGTYTVVVTNAVGSVTSAPVMLKVLTFSRALGPTDQPWRMTPAGSWFGQTNISLDTGVSAQSVAGTNDSSFETSVTGPLRLTFWWRFSAAYLSESINFDIDGTNYARLVGPRTWTDVSVTLSNGSHVLRWTRHALDPTTTAWVGQILAEVLWFTTQPSDASVLAGDPARLAAAPAQAATVQWLRDGVPLENATNTTLEFTSTRPSNAGDYRIVIASGETRATSVVAHLEVAPLRISDQPQSQTVIATSNATFAVTTDSRAPVAYRWYFGDTPVNGAGALFSLTAMPEQAGDYRVVASNIFGAVTSPPAQLTVLAVAPQVSQPTSYNAYAGETFSLSADVAAVPQASYTWMRNGRRLRGGTSATFTVKKIRPAQRGDYSVLARNPFGTVTQHIAVTVSTITIERAPQSQTVLLGDPIPLSVVAHSTRPLTYQWRFNGNRIEGATNSTYAFAPSSVADTGSYDVMLRGGRVTVTTPAAQVRVTGAPPIFTAQPEGRAVDFGDRVLLSAFATGRPAPSYQWYFNSAPVPNAREPILTLTGVTTNLDGDFFVVATNDYGAATSTIASVAVLSAAPQPKISPNDFSVMEGDFVILRASARTSPFATNFQWIVGTNDISGATNSRLVLPAITRAEAGKYRLSERNALGTGLSGSSVIDVRTPHALDLWKWSASLPRSEDLVTVTYGNGVFVAAGESGAILTSRDGLAWEDHSLLTVGRVSSMAFAGDKFCAVIEQPSEHPALIVSTNAVDWASTPGPPGREFHCIAAASNVFVAATADDQLHLAICTSFDAVTWNQFQTDLPIGNLSVANGSGTFVVACQSHIFVSPDATNWVTVSELPAVRGIAFGRGAFVAVGDNGRIWSSTNGAIWGAQHSPTSNDFNAVLFHRDRFIAAGNAGALYTSVDGATWQRAAASAVADIRALGSAPGSVTQRAVAAGKAGTLLSTENGISWTSRLQSLASGTLHDVLFTNGIFITVGDGGVILTSIDGRTWQSRASGTSKDLNSIVCGKAGFVVVGEDGKIIASPDGITWQSRASGTTETLNCVRYLNGTYVSVGDGGRVLTSIDGTNWTSRSIQLPGQNGALSGVAFGNGAFVAVGGYATTLTPLAHTVTALSPDGVSWILLTIDWGKKLRDITFDGAEFIGVGNDGLVVTSSEGLRWREQRIANNFENLRNVRSRQGMSLVVGNDGLVFSEVNGDWQRHRLYTAKNLQAVAFGYNLVVAVGTDGAILRSDPIFPVITPQTQTSDLFVKGGTEDYYWLQLSSDLLYWRDLVSVTNGIVQPGLIDTNVPLMPKKFFRLRSP